MKRQDKFPETESFYFHNANPKNKYTDDCVVRALSVALEQDYMTTLSELVELQVKTGYSLNDKKCYSKYLESKGWSKRTQPRYPNGRKLTGKEFCADLKRADENKVIAHIGTQHIVAIMDGQVWDTWDCTDDYVGNYWVPYSDF